MITLELLFEERVDVMRLADIIANATETERRRITISLLNVTLNATELSDVLGGVAAPSLGSRRLSSSLLNAWQVSIVLRVGTDRVQHMVGWLSASATEVLGALAVIAPPRVELLIIPGPSLPSPPYSPPMLLFAPLPISTLPPMPPSVRPLNMPSSLQSSPMSAPAMQGSSYLLVAGLLVAATLLLCICFCIFRRHFRGASRSAYPSLGFKTVSFVAKQVLHTRTGAVRSARRNVSLSCKLAPISMGESRASSINQAGAWALDSNSGEVDVGCASTWQEKLELRGRCLLKIADTSLRTGRVARSYSTKRAVRIKKADIEASSTTMATTPERVIHMPIEPGSMAGEEDERLNAVLRSGDSSDSDDLNPDIKSPTLKPQMRMADALSDEDANLAIDEITMSILSRRSASQGAAVSNLTVRAVGHGEGAHEETINERLSRARASALDSLPARPSAPSTTVCVLSTLEHAGEAVTADQVNRSRLHAPRSWANLSRNSSLASRSCGMEQLSVSNDLVISSPPALDALTEALHQAVCYGIAPPPPPKPAACGCSGSIPSTRCRLSRVRVDRVSKGLDLSPSLAAHVHRAQGDWIAKAIETAREESDEDDNSEDVRI